MRKSFFRWLGDVEFTRGTTAPTGAVPDVGQYGLLDDICPFLLKFHPVIVFIGGTKRLLVVTVEIVLWLKICQMWRKLHFGRAPVPVVYVITHPFCYFISVV